MRLYLENILVIDQWKRQGFTCYSYAKTYTNSTSVPIKIEYYQAIGGQGISFSLIKPVVVTNNIDLGEQIDGNNPGTLSYALKNSDINTPITFSGVNTIQVKGKLPNLPAKVTLQGICNAGKPSIVIDGSGISTVTDGLVLSGGNTLNGLKVIKFKGKQINSANSSDNHLSCIVTSK